MHLDDHRVGKNGEERVQAENMVRGLEHPSARATLRLKVLQEALLPLVSRYQTGGVKKPFITRNAIGGREFLRQQCVAVDGYTLVRRGGAHGMDRIGSGHNAPKPPKARGCLFNAPPNVVLSLCPQRKRKHHFPNQRCAVDSILYQQLMQKGGAASRHPGDEYRSGDALAIRSCRVAPKVD